MTTSKSHTGSEYAHGVTCMGCLAYLTPDEVEYGSSYCKVCRGPKPPAPLPLDERYGWNYVLMVDGEAHVTREEAESHFDAFVEGQEDARADLQSKYNALRAQLAEAVEALEIIRKEVLINCEYNQTVFDTVKAAQAELARLGKVGE